LRFYHHQENQIFIHIQVAAGSQNLPLPTPGKANSQHFARAAQNCSKNTHIIPPFAFKARAALVL
jgi:hypothetical protein